MSKKLRDKIYSMSNSFLPLDMFYNDIENMSKYPSFSKGLAFRDLEKIADFVLDLQSQLAEKDKEIEYQENMKILAVDNQNKKAIEQLEKVKDIINASVRDDHIIWDFDIKEHIDNQINELKGEKL